MNQEELHTFWAKNYPETAPVGHQLRHIYPDRWVRIHSLPHAQRYANNPAEYALLLARQNQLFADLLGENENVIRIFSYWPEDIQTKYYHELEELAHFEKTILPSLSPFQPQTSENKYITMLNLDHFQIGKWDKILKYIADDKIRMLFISPLSQRIIAPYDGGVDIILETSAKRNTVQKRYKNWLSQHPENL